MRLRSCKRCGKEYSTDRPGTYLCPACSSASRSTSVKDRVCRQCGTTFPGGPRAWYCQSCRLDRRREADRRHHKTGAARPIGSTDTCAICGAEYVVDGPRQRYCKDCADSATKDAVRAHKREYAADNKDAMTAYKKGMRKNRSVCAVCGSVFTASTATVTCSPACAAQLRKIRQDEADIRRGRRKSPAVVRYDSGLPKSGIVGVTARRNGKWQAVYKGHYIGVFDTIREAADAIEKYKEGKQ